MTESDLSEIERRVQAAAASGWHSPDNAIFLAHVEKDVAALIAEVRRLRAGLAVAVERRSANDEPMLDLEYLLDGPPSP